VTFGRMVGAGARGLRAWWRVALGIYLAEAAVGLLVTLVVWRTLGSIYGELPLFDRGVDGDFAALVGATREHRGVIHALMWGGVGIALAWALVSFYLAPGLLGVFAGRAFGTAARRQFWAFVRLAAWSTVPAAVALAIAAIGASLTGAMHMTYLSRWHALATLRGAIPGALLLVAVMCAVDYARADLVARDATGAGRAILRALRLTFTRPLPLAHFGAYVVLIVALALVYVLVSCAVAGVVLFAWRQIFLAARFALRAIASGGQVELVRFR